MGFALSLTSFNASALEPPLVIEKNQKHFEVANRFALYSLGLRLLKDSACANKVSITDHSKEDLAFIRRTFTEEENIYFSEDVVAIELMEREEIESDIASSIETTGNIDAACLKLERLYESNYKTAKEDFSRFIKAKLKP